MATVKRRSIASPKVSKPEPKLALVAGADQIGSLDEEIPAAFIGEMVGSSDIPF